MSAEFEVVFFLIFDQSMILIPACYDIDISTYRNEIRVSVTYLTTITLISIGKIDIH